MKWTLPTATTGASVRVTDPGSQWQWKEWHVYCSGVFAGSVAQVQISPDDSFVTDANSRWFSPSQLLFGGMGEVFFRGRFRKCRAVSTAGDGTTAITVEIV